MTRTTEDETLPPAVLALLAAGREPFAERQRHLRADIDESRQRLLKGILAELRDEPGFDPVLAAYLTDVRHQFDTATAEVTLELPGCWPIAFTMSRRAAGGEWRLVRQGELLKLSPIQGTYYHAVEGGFRVRLRGSEHPTPLTSLAVAAAAARECYRDFSVDGGPPAHGCVTSLATPAGDIDREAARRADTLAAFDPAGPLPGGSPRRAGRGKLDTGYDEDRDPAAIARHENAIEQGRMAADHDDPSVPA